MISGAILKYDPILLSIQNLFLFSNMTRFRFQLWPSSILIYNLFLFLKMAWICFFEGSAIQLQLAAREAELHALANRLGRLRRSLTTGAGLRSEGCQAAGRCPEVVYFRSEQLSRHARASVWYFNYTEHCSVWSYRFYRYYTIASTRMTVYVLDEKGRFLRWPDGAIRKIVFIYLFIVNLIYIIFN